MEGKHIIIFSFMVHSLFFELQTTCFELISYFELYLEIYVAAMNNKFSALELRYEAWVLKKTYRICIGLSGVWYFCMCIELQPSCIVARIT